MSRLLIGVIITDCHIDFQEEILRGIISQSFKSNCDTAIIAPFHNFSFKTDHKENERRIFNLILSDKFDGFLYDRATFYDEEIKKYIDSLLTRSGKPVMLLDSANHKSFETATIDDSEAFETITDHLIEVHGHTRICCLTGPKGTFVAEERLKGFKNSMRKHGLYYDRNCVRYGDFWKDSAREMADDIISGNIERPEAVVCGNDVMAVTLTAALMAGGIKVPEDIAVTGYDASMDGYRSVPSITSYSRPNFQLGAEAFRRLYRIITGKICNKVPNEYGKLRLGRSCGCSDDPKLRHDIVRKENINQRFESDMLYGDMLFDITNADNPEDFAEKIDHYTYLLYKMSHLFICLSRKYIESPQNNFGDVLTFNPGDEMKMIISKNSVSREPASEEYFSSNELLPIFSQERGFPVAYYISPLHYNNNFFGYCAVSYGKEPLSFSSLYLKWINYVNVALEQVRIKAMMNKTIFDTNRVLLYDEYTGLLNRNGLVREVAVSASVPVDCIRIQLTGLSKMYYQSGEEQCRKIGSAFARAVRDCLHDRELCGVWSMNTMCVITFTPDRAEEFFLALSERVRESQFSGQDNCNIDFTVGQYTFPDMREPDLPDAVHKAAVNRIYSYSLSEHNANPQFEKLCLLRNKIMKNPEEPWNISEIADQLYLSKSYLQKIYKTYFGKSIIEEMIQFRIDKAKALLSGTDRTVTDISRECGYSSYNYFVRQFKSAEGVSPSEYRTSCKT